MIHAKNLLITKLLIVRYPPGLNLGRNPLDYKQTPTSTQTATKAIEKSAPVATSKTDTTKPSSAAHSQQPQTKTPVHVDNPNIHQAPPQRAEVSMQERPYTADVISTKPQPVNMQERPYTADVVSTNPPPISNNERPYTSGVAHAKPPPPNSQKARPKSAGPLKPKSSTAQSSSKVELSATPIFSSSRMQQHAWAGAPSPVDRDQFPRTSKITDKLRQEVFEADTWSEDHPGDAMESKSQQQNRYGAMSRESILLSLEVKIEENLKYWDDDFKPKDPTGRYDLSSPQEKMEKIDKEIELLKAQGNTQELVNKLVEKRTLAELAFGTDNYIYIQSNLEISVYYIQESLFRTALDHLSRAVSMSTRLTKPEAHGLSTVQRDQLLSRLFCTRAHCFIRQFEHGTGSKESLRTALADLNHSQEFYKKAYEDIYDTDEYKKGLADINLAFILVAYHRGQIDDCYGLIRKAHLHEESFALIRAELTDPLKKLMVEFRQNKGDIDKAIGAGHILYSIYSSTEQQTKAMKVHIAVARYHMDQGDHRNARSIIEQHLEDIKKRTGAGSDFHRRVLADYAKCLVHVEEFSLAKDTLNQTLRYYNEKDSKMDLDYAGLHRLLARVHQGLKDDLSAELHYQEALQVYLKVHGQNHPGTQKILSHIKEIRKSQLHTSD
eukprot:TRINITY_DN1994_c0_g3_i2.p1 TRINITY_DN1994_c0_g3~~TRINITY_DN1994_c0_g3_i2.p1  ORF type:complete len:665 (-),score=128.04 TRINITY_DN1994_c0_g3_i2:194-2188(-)